MKKVNIKLALIHLSVLLAVGCSDDNDDNKGQDRKGDILITISQPNPDGMSGAYYMQLIDSDNLSEGINLGNATPIPFYGAFPRVYKNDIFVFPSYVGGTANELLKYSVKEGIMTQSGRLNLPANSGANNIVHVSPEKAYLAMSALGKILVFNPTTMTKTGEIDLSSLALEDSNPDAGSMIYRDGYLFVGLNQMVGGYSTPAHYKQSDVAIIDTENNTILKRISTTVNSISQATRPVDPFSIFMDEKEDIYMNCLGNFGYVPGHNPGFLRIKKGELEFDETYNWAISKTKIAGNEDEVCGFVASVFYAGNGVAYGYVDIPGHYGEGTGHTAFSQRAVKYDLYNKTLTTIQGLELSNGYATMTSNVDNDVIIGNASKTSKGVYMINKETNSVFEEPFMKTGFSIISWLYINK